MFWIYYIDTKTSKMKSISLKMDEKIFIETEKILAEIKVSRNRYINEAVAYYNQQQRKKLLEDQLEIESAIVKEISMNVLDEFEKMEYED